MQNENELAEMNSIPWFHSITLPDGTVTPGSDDSAARLQRTHLPADLTGKRVLDIGAWDGFFTFEAERRGGDVVALDGGVWKVPEIGRRGFEFARRAFKSSVNTAEMDVLEICPERLGMFDVVLFLGVLYHLPHPFLALQKVASVASDMLILETHADFLTQDRPAIAFYPTDECAEDITNWCGPNRPAIEAMLRVFGFRRFVAFDPTPVHYGVRGADPKEYGRIVIHAWKSE